MITSLILDLLHWCCVFPSQKKRFQRRQRPFSKIHHMLSDLLSHLVTAGSGIHMYMLTSSTRMKKLIRALFIQTFFVQKRPLDWQLRWAPLLMSTNARLAYIPSWQDRTNKMRSIFLKALQINQAWNLYSIASLDHCKLMYELLG